MVLFIDPDAKPIAHDPPYKPIDPSRPGRKVVITRAEITASGAREPDPASYQYDILRQVWRLKVL
jgi:hypothetical protein